MFSCRWIAALSFTILVSAPAWGDTVVTKDGRKFTGEVTRADGICSVKTKMGTIPISEADVAQIIAEDSAPPVTAIAPPHPNVAAGATSNATAVAHPASGPLTTNGKPLDPKLVPALVQQGQTALAAGEFPAARDAFSDAMTLDSRNVTALHGKALALMYMGDFHHAAEFMERALAVNLAPDRAVVINAAVLYIGLREPMRSAKLVRAYLTAHPKDVDEPMLNALAVALNSCDAQTKKAPFFQQCADFYVVANAKLEEHVPGYKRWGIAWLTAADADAKNKDWHRDLRTAELLDRELGYEDAKVADCQKNLDEAQAASGRRASWMVDDAKRKLDSARASRDDTNAKLHDAQDKAHGPEFPRTMTAVALDDLTAPAVGPSTVVVAAATPLPPAPTPMDTSMPRTHPTPAQVGTEVAVKPGKPDKPVAEHPAPAAEPSEPAIVLAPKPRKRGSITTYAAAFPVTADLLVTSAAAVDGASDIALQGSDGSMFKGTVVRVDAVLGLGLVRLTDHKMNPLVLGAAMAEGTVRCVSFPTPNIFTPNAESIPGSAESNGDGWKLKLPRNPRLAGGPVLAAGKVIAVEMATRDADPAQLPCVTIEQMLKFLGDDAPKAAGSNSDAVGTIVQLSATRESN